MFVVVNITRLILSILITELAGAIGSLVTIPSVNGWYRTLRKPSFNPPDSVFGPVWTFLYLLMGIALYIVWEKARNEDEQPALKVQSKRAITAFTIQLGLNTLWPFLFFGLNSPLYGFIDIILLWFAIMSTIILFAPISITAAILLIPYILWVSFAAVLNYQIWQLNRI